MFARPLETRVQAACIQAWLLAYYLIRLKTMPASKTTSGNVMLQHNSQAKTASACPLILSTATDVGISMSHQPDQYVVFKPPVSFFLLSCSILRRQWAVKYGAGWYLRVQDQRRPTAANVIISIPDTCACLVKRGEGAVRRLLAR